MWESQFLVLASGTALMADQLRAQILDWSRYPTLTSLESMSVPVEEAPFPAVTVCQGRDFLHFFNFMEFLLYLLLFAIGCRKEPLWPREALGTLGNFWSGSPRENISKTPTEGSYFYFLPTSQLKKPLLSSGTNSSPPSWASDCPSSCASPQKSSRRGCCSSWSPQTSKAWKGTWRPADRPSQTAIACSTGSSPPAGHSYAHQQVVSWEIRSSLRSPWTTS